jgi:hypothetical protein
MMHPPFVLVRTRIFGSALHHPTICTTKHPW